MYCESRAARIIHQALSNLVILTNCCNHVPQFDSDNSYVKFLWDFCLSIYHVISTRCPDIAVVNKKKAFVQIINVAVPIDYIVTNKEAKEEDKYRDISIELVFLWKNEV